MVKTQLNMIRLIAQPSLTLFQINLSLRAFKIKMELDGFENQYMKLSASHIQVTFLTFLELNCP